MSTDTLFSTGACCGASGGETPLEAEVGVVSMSSEPENSETTTLGDVSPWVGGRWTTFFDTGGVDSWRESSGGGIEK